MSQRMEFGESNPEEATYSVREDTRGYYGYATGFGGMDSGQKLSGLAIRRGASAGQRLALAIVSLVLWVIVLFGIVGLAIVNHADDTAGIYILLMLLLFSALIAVINVVFNRH